MKKDLISIIIPVFNTEKYLKECIESVLQQSYHMIEVLLVDDGSTDNSLQVCQFYAEKDSRIKIFRKSNGGLSSARNLGIDNANGAYFAFVDSDDYIDENMIEKLYLALEKENADMAICNFQCVLENKEKVQLNQKYLREEVLLAEDAIKALFSEELGSYVIAWNKLYKKELWNDLHYPEGYIHEDEFMIHHLLCRCKKVVTISDSLYYYRQVPGSIMHSGRNEKKLDKYVALADRILFLKKCVSDDNLKKLSYQYWFHYLEDFFYFRELNKKSIRLKRMKKSLVKVLPIMAQCGFFKKKDTIGILIFLLKPEIYEKLFWKKGEQK